ncbi:MAG: hypothetical protein QN715_02440 [Nitrososphaeraceae archaeon]|nr:hypothetical protein [Nitrososphaeraceae archaeon]
MSSLILTISGERINFSSYILHILASRYYKIDYSRCRFIRIIMKQLGLLGCDEQEQPIIPAGVYAYYKCLTKYIYVFDIL